MHEKQERIQSFRNTVKSTFERSLEITRTQFGKYIFVFVETLGADEAIKRLTEGKDQLPKNLIFDTHENFNQTDYIHTDAVKITTIEDITWHSNPYTT
ncbi:hypothetical protein [Methylovulum psychrotolerans]|uniref:Uncharacterized protein n=1 Tax=Methylovulum psychrotolerans TaxID=1704499 RepID=A0A1Z4C496_9GAMM|nr:hypothetical protein [Methylovulum psychrotolerans]ASF48330.1 hypothetical protein CEK71_20940 [Methylovulum psychrotolerans]